MTEWIIQHELSLRLSFFFGILTIMAFWEYLAPRRMLTAAKSIRWLNNLALVFVNSLLLRWLFPMTAVSFALLAQEHHWGLFNIFNGPILLEILLALVILDMAIYFQHVLFHALPLLWSIHRMHHADVDFDVTTGNRFHPLEIFLSMVFKLAVIMVLGAPVVAVIMFEIVLNGMAMFNHSNIQLPLDRWLRWVIVTPDMHRVHHSVFAHETNSNFGFNLSLWDRLFGTYRQQPQAGHHHMHIGLEQFRQAHYLTLPWLLIIPFLGRKQDYTINR